jgi:hypothetical protein
MAFLEESLMEGWFEPLYFSGVPEYPNEILDPNWGKQVPKF